MQRRGGWPVRATVFVALELADQQLDRASAKHLRLKVDPSAWPRAVDDVEADEAMVLGNFCAARFHPVDGSVVVAEHDIGLMRFEPRTEILFA